VKVSDAAISVDILDNLSTPRTINLKFGRLMTREYEVTVNKKPLGRFSSTALTKGIKVAI